MDVSEFWQLFLETGAPEAYLMYSKAKAMEDSRVFDNKSTGASDLSIQ